MILPPRWLAALLVLVGILLIVLARIPDPQVSEWVRVTFTSAGFSGLVTAALLIATAQTEAGAERRHRELLEALRHLGEPHDTP